MRLTYTTDLEQFRAELIRWVDENRPTDADIARDPAMSSAHLPAWARTWIRRQFDAGWLKPSWPTELGGRNATAEQELVYYEEMSRQGVVRSPNPQGLDIVAPSLRDFGDDGHRDAFLLPLLRGEKSAAIAMSEPGTGSDLAGLTTRAILRDEHFIVNGQKVWTSGANEADFCICFVRTDPDAPKHKGLSALLIDLDSPGVTIRPFAQATGVKELDFNEVFFDDVRVPATQLVGELNGGWAVANGSLGHERALMWLLDAANNQRRMEDLIDVARSRPGIYGNHAADDPLVRDAIARLAIDTQAVWAIGYRGVARMLRGRPAPELGVLKLFGSETGQAIERTILDLAGFDGLRAPEAGVSEPLMAGDRRSSAPFIRYLASFNGTIAGGTSEIQRNIIAERVLGLPRG